MVSVCLSVTCWYASQEAQLSQRDRTMRCVIEYFAKSLKVIQNDTVELGVCKSLLVFLCLCCTISEIIIIVTKTMFMVLSSWQSHCESSPGSFWWMWNGAKRPTTQHQARRLRLWVRLYRLPETTPTIAIYYYYSARKLILILTSHRG